MPGHGRALQDKSGEDGAPRLGRTSCQGGSRQGAYAGQRMSPRHGKEWRLGREWQGFQAWQSNAGRLGMAGEGRAPRHGKVIQVKTGRLGMVVQGKAPRQGRERQGASSR
jgi:hypothetical protein